LTWGSRALVLSVALRAAQTLVVRKRHCTCESQLGGWGNSLSKHEQWEPLASAAKEGNASHLTFLSEALDRRRPLNAGQRLEENRVGEEGNTKIKNFPYDKSTLRSRLNGRARTVRDPSAKFFFFFFCYMCFTDSYIYPLCRTMVRSVPTLRSGTTSNIKNKIFPRSVPGDRAPGGTCRRRSCDATFKGPLDELH